jgi:hypothetical protein
MTTSWAYATRGQWVDAVRTHACGTMSALVAAAGGIVALTVAATGRRPMRQPSEAVIISLVVVGAALVLGEWIARLASA